ncbi:MAG: urate hydroxylase PuuD [Gemmatimonadaceae bacterium]
MTGMAIELLDLVARWVHVIAGIMWVGNSLLFNWLDRNLVAHPDQTQPASLRTGGQQSIWLLHSGGFYFVEKTLLPGQSLPVPLHWFKWQAYATWLSGVALLFIVYWAGGRAVMVEPGRGTMSHMVAAEYAAGLILLGWMTYEFCNRVIAPRMPAVSLAIWVLVLAAISFVLVDTLNGRAAYTHVGAMLATIMAGNVFFTIVPSQRQLVASVNAGSQASAAADSARAKRVSIHNNYFTFPVIVLMVSNHFPAINGAPNAWLMLLVLTIGGAGVRHVLNDRNTTPHWKVWLAVTMATTVVALYGLSMKTWDVATTSDRAASGPVTFADARHIIDRRCSVCHSAQPADDTFGIAPGGVAFDTPDQIGAYANRINERAVVSRTMPFGNKTHMTGIERDLIARWFAQGAPIR